MSECPRQAPLFSFGIIADVQYADIDDGHNFLRTRKRYYRSSIQLLRQALKSWSEAAVTPDFILQLGDIIDGFNRRHEASEQALEVVLKEFSSSPAKVHHVWGNHEFYNFNRTRLLSSELNSRPDAERSLSDSDTNIYAYHFSPHPGFSFIILDAYDLSVLGREESSEQYKEAMLMLRQHNDNEDLNQPAGIVAYLSRNDTASLRLCYFDHHVLLQAHMYPRLSHKLASFPPLLHQQMSSLFPP